METVYAIRERDPQHTTNSAIVWIRSKRSRAAVTLPAERFRPAIFLMDMVV
jgi:hypothetical protein